ncbi:unnamed protein product, partial [Iphiclides podalirius]
MPVRFNDVKARSHVTDVQSYKLLRFGDGGTFQRRRELSRCISTLVEATASAQLTVHEAIVRYFTDFYFRGRASIRRDGLTLAREQTAALLFQLRSIRTFGDAGSKALSLGPATVRPPSIPSQGWTSELFLFRNLVYGK